MYLPLICSLLICLAIKQVLPLTPDEHSPDIQTGRSTPRTEVAPEATLTECTSPDTLTTLHPELFIKVPETAPEVLLDMLLTLLDCKAEKEPKPVSCRRWAGGAKAEQRLNLVDIYQLQNPLSFAMNNPLA